MIGALLLALAMLVAACFLLWLERGAIFMSDEWSWVHVAGGIVDPLSGGPGSGNASLKDLLVPFNQHLMFVPLLIFKGLLAASGTDFLPFKLVGLLAVLACSGLVYEYSRRRIGPIAALAPAMVPLFFGTSASILLQPLIGFQMIFAIPLGIGALLLVERNDRRRDIAACSLLFVAVVTYSTALTFVVGVGVAILLGPRPRLRRAYVVAAPILLYAAWRLWANHQVGTGGGPELVNVPILPFYFIDSLAAVVTSLFGLESIVSTGPAPANFLSGPSLAFVAPAVVFAAFELIAIALVARRLARRGPVPATFWAILATLVTLWVLQGLVLGETRLPGELRYLYTGAVLLILVGAEVARGAYLSRLGLGLLLGLTAVGVIGNLPHFQEGRTGLVFHSTRARAYTAALELDAAHVNPHFDPALDTPQVAPAMALKFSAGSQLEFVRRYGSLGLSPAQLPAQSEEVRQGVDLVLARALGFQLEPVSGKSAAGCYSSHHQATRREIDLPTGGVTLVADGPTGLMLRRFADAFTVPLEDLRPGVPARLSIPADRALKPWVVRTTRPVDLKICRPPTG